MPQLDRRTFIRWTSAGVATQLFLGCKSDSGGSMPGSPDGGGAPAQPDARPPDGGGDGGGLDVPDLENRTPASVVRGSRAELDVELQVLAGRLPTDMHGHYFMVCATPWGDGTPVPNGDGMIHRIDFGDGAPRIKTRLTKTPCYYAEQALAGTDGAFTNNGFARMAPNLGVRNQANTAFAPMAANRMLVTFDAGRPFEIDPVSLEVVTAVGYHSEWRPGLPAIAGGFLGNVFPLVMATAHPCHDPHTGELFAVNYGSDDLFQPFTDVVRWDGSSELERWTLVDEGGGKVQIDQSAHQIQITDKYVVVLDCAFRVEVNPLDPNEFRPQNPNTVMYVVERADLASTASGGEVLARRYQIAKESPHFLVDYDNPDGKLVVHVVHNAGYDGSEWLKPDDVRYDDQQPMRSDIQGMLTGPTDINYIGRHVIDVPNDRVLESQSVYLSDDEMTWGVTLYAHRGVWSPAQHEDLWWISTGFQGDVLPQRVGRAYESYQHRTVPTGQLPFATGKPAGLFRTSVRDAAIADGYSFPKGYFASSPHFVPRGSADADDGYIVCTVVSDDTETAGSSGDEYWIFDAGNLAQGPLCRLGHRELDMPFTLHTTWLPTIEPRVASYAVDVRADHEGAVAGLDANLKQMFEDEVYPRFE